MSISLKSLIFVLKENKSAYIACKGIMLSYSGNWLVTTAIGSEEYMLFDAAVSRFYTLCEENEK